MGSDADGPPPCTSVIIPVRNGEAYLGEAIDSVLSQLAERDEIVVVNDGSVDRTKAILAACSDRRVRLLEGKSRGPSAARNIGLAAARGSFIAFLDHDDIWPASRHAVLLRTLLDHPDIDAAHGRQRIRIEAGAHDRIPPRAAATRHVPSNIMFTALFRRRILETVGGFAEDMRYCEDVDCCARLYEAGMRAMACDVDALVYRHHDSNATRDRAALKEANLEFLRRKIARARLRRLATELPNQGTAS